MDNALYQLITMALVSWQAKVIVGLILLDVVFGIAAALRRGVFQWRRVADFYRTDVLPYILGYVVLYVTIHFVLPADVAGIPGDFLTETSITLAWGAIMGSLGRSAWVNFLELYRPSQVANE